MAKYHICGGADACIMYCDLKGTSHLQFGVNKPVELSCVATTWVTKLLVVTMFSVSTASVAVELVLDWWCLTLHGMDLSWQHVCLYHQQK